MPSNVRLKRLWTHFGCVCWEWGVFMCAVQDGDFPFYESCLPHSENVAGISFRIQNEPHTKC